LLQLAGSEVSEAPDEPYVRPLPCVERYWIVPLVPLGCRMATQ
jgi:hypothetical protein